MFVMIALSIGRGPAGQEAMTVFGPGGVGPLLRLSRNISVAALPTPRFRSGTVDEFAVHHAI